MKAKPPGRRARTRALLVQALYQHQLTGADVSDIKAQFRERAAFARAADDMFDDLLSLVIDSRAELDTVIDTYADRPRDQLDPVELAIIYLALAELRSTPETPYRVVINEAVSLARQFGAEDGHKYVNAICDKAAAEFRADEYRARAG